MSNDNETVRILITRETNEYELDEIFITHFKVMCDKGIPILGFMKDEYGGWMFGVKEVFEDVFRNAPFVLEDFDVHKYIKEAPLTERFWLADLDENDPKKSKLLKYVY